MAQLASITRAYGSWLNAFSFQLFCAFTFTWAVSDAQADKVFRAFINALEKAHRSPITWVRGDEKRFAGAGKPASPRHFHVLMASAVALNPEVVKLAWAQFSGNGKSGANSDVRPYDPARNGAEYCLKFISQPHGDWNFGNLDLLSSDFTPANARSRRRLRRRLERQRGHGADRCSPEAEALRARIIDSLKSVRERDG